MIKVGEHITLDIIGTTKEYDSPVFEKVINKIAKAADVTILNISKYKFEPQGFTILALLAESHISFHTFPEKGIISFDFFTCGKICPSVAIDIVKKDLKEKDFAITDISHSRAVIQIKGMQAKEVLKKGSPINFNEFDLNRCVGTVFHGITVVVDSISNDPDTFNLLTLRSFGESFYHHITDSALEFGYVGE